MLLMMVTDMILQIHTITTIQNQPHTHLMVHLNQLLHTLNNMAFMEPQNTMVRGLKIFN
jgi:hypothetical protein